VELGQARPGPSSGSAGSAWRHSCAVGRRGTGYKAPGEAGESVGDRQALVVVRKRRSASGTQMTMIRTHQPHIEATGWSSSHEPEEG
jgi:hypothetical protein